jgi:hypothetical protein
MTDSTTPERALGPLWPVALARVRGQVVDPRLHIVHADR